MQTYMNKSKERRRWRCITAFKSTQSLNVGNIKTVEGWIFFNIWLNHRLASSLRQEPRPVCGCRGDGTEGRGLSTEPSRVWFLNLSGTEEEAASVVVWNEMDLVQFQGFPELPRGFIKTKGGGRGGGGTSCWTEANLAWPHRTLGLQMRTQGLKG